MSFRNERHWSHSKTAVHVTEPVLNVISMYIGRGVCVYVYIEFLSLEHRLQTHILAIA